MDRDLFFKIQSKLKYKGNKMKKSDFLLLTATVWLAPYNPNLFNVVAGLGLLIYGIYSLNRGD